MELVYYPHEFLRRQVQPVDLNEPGFDPKELEKELIETMNARRGIGLSANQVALDKQVFVMGDEQYASMVINPTVLQYTEETVKEYEGCLSFPEVFVPVVRPREILAHFYDSDLNEQTVKLTDYTARVYLHELDHLLGITMKDRVSNLVWDKAVRKTRKLQRKRS